MRGWVWRPRINIRARKRAGRLGASSTSRSIRGRRRAYAGCRRLRWAPSQRWNKAQMRPPPWAARKPKRPQAKKSPRPRHGPETMMPLRSKLATDQERLCVTSTCCASSVSAPRNAADRGRRSCDPLDRRRRLVRRGNSRDLARLYLGALLAPGATGSGSREERDRLLAEAEIILGGWPFPLDLRARAPS